MQKSSQFDETSYRYYYNKPVLILDSNHCVRSISSAFLSAFKLESLMKGTPVNSIMSFDFNLTGFFGWRDFCASGKGLLQDKQFRGIVLQDGCNITLIFDTTVLDGSKLLTLFNRASAKMRNAHSIEDIFYGTADELTFIGIDSMVLLFDSNSLSVDYLLYRFTKEFVAQNSLEFDIQLKDSKLLQSQFNNMAAAANAQRCEYYQKAAFECSFLSKSIKETINKMSEVLNKNIIVAPFVVNNDVLGTFLTLSSDLQNTHISVVNAFANQLGSAIERAMLVQSARTNIEKLEESYKRHEDLLNRFEMATKAGKVGVWDVDLINDHFHWDDVMYDLFQVPRNTQINHQTWDNLVHPEDLVGALNNLNKALAGLESYDTEFRIVWPDGSIRYIKANAVVHKDSFGKPIRMIGTNWDITDRKVAEKELSKSENLLRKIFNTLPIGLWYADKDGNLFEANPAVSRIWGEQRFVGMQDYGIFKAKRYPSGEAIYTDDWALVDTIKKGTTTADEMLEIETFDGKKRIIMNYCAPVLDDDGKVDGAIMIQEDVTDKTRAEEALHAEKELLRTTLQSIGDGVVVTDNAGKITIINPVFEKFIGRTKQEALGKKFEEFVYLEDQNSEKKCENPVQLVQKTGRIVTLSGNIVIKRHDGKTIPVANTAAPIRNPQGFMQGVALVFRDMTEERKRREKIDYLVHHDSLTGLYNRRYFNQQLAKLDVAGNLPLSIISCDVNGLKLTNDAFGHDMGDQLLKKMAHTLTKACRSCDIVVRAGGDEFLIILPKTNDVQAAGVCDRIKRFVSKVDMGVVDFALSVGCCTKQDICIDVGEVLKKAEDNMYRNKFFGSSDADVSVNTIMKSLYKKCPIERQHSSRVSEMSKQIGRALGLLQKDIDELSIIGAMHDIGKVAIDDAVLNKQSLSKQEKMERRRHAEMGFRILRGFKNMVGISDYVLAHHERYDGTGYPKGLRGEEIPLKARVVTVADAFDNILNQNSQFTQSQAVEKIVRGSGTYFDPDVVKAFKDLFEQEY